MCLNHNCGFGGAYTGLRPYHPPIQFQSPRGLRLSHVVAREAEPLPIWLTHSAVRLHVPMPIPSRPIAHPWAEGRPGCLWVTWGHRRGCESPRSAAASVAAPTTAGSDATSGWRSWVGHGSGRKGPRPKIWKQNAVIVGAKIQISSLILG
jgi:hypothetical protein